MPRMWCCTRCAIIARFAALRGCYTTHFLRITSELHDWDREGRSMKELYRSFFAELAKKRTKEERALSERIAAGPPDRRIKMGDWEQWCRNGWVLCPGSKSRRVCEEESCQQGLSCHKLAAVGLLGTGEAVSKLERVRCGAKTRLGTECRMAVVPGKHRCRMHGGLSSGPKTSEGRGRIAEAQKRRWQKQKEAAPPECPPEAPPSRTVQQWRRRRRPSNRCV